jgi:hypothetical protein
LFIATPESKRGIRIVSQRNSSMKNTVNAPAAAISFLKAISWLRIDRDLPMIIWANTIMTKNKTAIMP